MKPLVIRMTNPRLSGDSEKTSEIASALVTFDASTTGSKASGRALFNGALTLIKAPFSDAVTVIRKAISATDFARARNYVETEKWITEGLGKKITPGLSDEGRIKFARYASTWIGTPSIVAEIAMAGAGIGMAKVFSTQASVVVQPLSDTLSHVTDGLIQGPNATLCVAALLAVSVIAVKYAALNISPMHTNASFSERRDAALLKLEQWRNAATYKPASNPQFMADAIKRLEQKFKEDFSSDSHLCGDSLIRLQRAIIGKTSEYAAIQTLSDAEQKGLRKITGVLVDTYGFEAGKSSHVAIQLALTKKGDLPLILATLKSQDLPADWVTRFQFNPDKVVRHTAGHDRTFETARLFNAGIDAIKAIYHGDDNRPGAPKLR